MCGESSVQRSSTNNIVSKSVRGRRFTDIMAIAASFVLLVAVDLVACITDQTILPHHAVDPRVLDMAVPLATAGEGPLLSPEAAGHHVPLPLVQPPAPLLHHAGGLPSLEGPFPMGQHGNLFWPPGILPPRPQLLPEPFPEGDGLGTCGTQFDPCNIVPCCPWHMCGPSLHCMPMPILHPFASNVGNLPLPTDHVSPAAVDGAQMNHLLPDPSVLQQHVTPAVEHNEQIVNPATTVANAALDQQHAAANLGTIPAVGPHTVTPTVQDSALQLDASNQQQAATAQQLLNHQQITNIQPAANSPLHGVGSYDVNSPSQQQNAGQQHINQQFAEGSGNQQQQMNLQNTNGATNMQQGGHDNSLQIKQLLQQAQQGIASNTGGSQTQQHQ